MSMVEPGDRSAEWFVPSFGPPKFKVFIGLLFLPYTAMVLSYTVMGSMLAEVIYWDRVVAIVAIYFLALGIGGHALDALGSKGHKPWGTIFSQIQLRLFSVISIVGAYGIGIYYMVFYAPLLWIIAIPEGFFLIAYNLELFEGRFHSDGWFALSWGGLPVLAGYILQTNALSLAAILLAISMGMLSLAEIKVSRPYKHLKLQSQSMVVHHIDGIHMQRLESILKCLSIGVIILGVGLVVWRLGGI